MKSHGFWCLGRADGPSSAADNAEHCPYLQKARRHISVARLLFIIGVLAPVRVWAGKNAPPKPIITPAELATAAAEVPVMRLDFTLPDEKDPMQSDALSKRFFNQPEEMRYGGVASTDWHKKWDLFAKALIDKAANNKLNASSLKKCLTALNYGRNRPPSGISMYCDPTYPPNTSEEKIKADREAGQKRAEKENKKIQAHPERYNDNISIIPVGAYLAKYSKGDCWVVVCKWESFSEKQAEVRLGHIMIWAMDAKTAEVVAYTTCD